MVDSGYREMLRRMTGGADKVLLYKPTNPKTMAFHQSISKTRLLLGGKRSSKSTTAMMEAIWAGCGIHPFLNYPDPPLKVRYCGVDFLAGIKGIVLPMLKFWIGDFDNGPIAKRYWAEERILELKNGTEFDFKSYDQPVEKFEGVPRNLVIEDEIPPLDIHQSNVMRTADVEGKIVIAGTPLHGLDWVYDTLYDNPDAIPPIVEYWHIRTDENPYTPVEEIELIKRDPSMKDNLEAALYGEFIPKSGLVFKSYSDKNIKPMRVPSSDDMIILGIDPHDRNPWGVVFVILNRENEYIVYDEILQSGTVQELGPLIKTKLKGRTPQLCVMDSSANVQQATSGKSIKEQLQAFGLYFQDPDKDVPSGILTLNSLLAKDDEKNPRLYITENCVQLQRQFRHCIWEDWARNRNQKDPKERILKRDDHLLDALRYCVMLPVVYHHPSFRRSAPAPEQVSSVTGYYRR